MFKTLIVDDNQNFRQLLKEILCARFPAMTIAESGTAAGVMEQVKSLEPDLVLMDVKLPDGNGLTLTRKIKSDRSDTVVIVITAYDLEEYRYAALQAGANHFLTKDSFVTEDFLSLVEFIAAVGLFDDKDYLFHVKAGEKLFSKGDKPDNLYVLKSGTADVLIDGRVVERASHGTILGEMALIDQEPRAASVLATSDCSFYVIGPDYFDGLIQKRPQFATLVMRVLVKRIRAANHFALIKPGEK